MASSASGWGRGNFGSGKWGTPTTIVSVDGSAGTGTLGDESIVIDVTIVETGLAATGSVGDPSIIGDANVSPTGLEATGTVGDERPVWSEILTDQTPSWTEISTTQTPGWTEIAT